MSQSDHRSITPFLEFIDRYDGILALYPQNIEPGNVVAALLTSRGISGKTVLMMVQNPKSVDSAAGVKIPDQLYIPYDNSDYLKSALNNNSYIIVDSPYLFRLSKMNRFIKDKGPNSRIIFVATLGVLDEDLSYIKEFLPRFDMIRLSLAREGPNLIYSPQVTIMSPEQDSQWDSEKDIDRKLQIATLLSSEEEEISSPKIKKLLTIIVAKYDQKHVIYSKFLEGPGIKKICADLKRMDISYSFDNSDKDEESDKYRVVITNKLDIDISNVCNIHFIEGVDCDTYQCLLNHTFRHRLLRSAFPHSFTVYFHVAQRNNGSDASDAQLYHDISIYIEKRQKIYREIYTKSKPIGFLQNHGFVVINNTP